MTATMTHARFHRLDHMNLRGLRALNRDRTVVLLPIGMLEQHGGHLPLGTDTFSVMALSLAAAAWLLEHDKSLHVVQMPGIPYGTDPVDLRRPELFEQAGSVWLSAATLKQVVSDVIGHMVRYGFMNIFPIGYHGGPGQSIALDEICADLRARHPGLHTYEPMGYVMVGAEEDVEPGLATLLGRPLTTMEQVALQGSIHASMYETSVMLHLNPELVDPAYKGLRTIEWNQLYSMKDWPGYIGAGPAHANPEIGAAMLRWRGVRAGALIKRAIAGEDLSGLPRHPRWVSDDESLISDAPPEEELRAAGPFIESKPAMQFSADAVRKAREQHPTEPILDFSEADAQTRPGTDTPPHIDEPGEV